MNAYRHVALLLVSVSSAFGQTTASGALAGDTTWSGTVTLSGDLTVPAGVTLTIQPGTVVTAAASDTLAAGTDTSRVEIIVNGALIADGTEASPITFKGSTPADPQAWSGITVVGGSVGSSFRHGRFSQMSAGVKLESVSTFANSICVDSKACVMVNVQSSIVPTTVTGNVFSGSQHTSGALYLFDGKATVRGNVFINNYTSIQVSSGDGVTIDNNSFFLATKFHLYASGRGPVTITDNIVVGSAWYGLYQDDTGQLTVQNNDFWNNATNSNVSFSWIDSNLSVDPRFVNSTSAPYDLHLQPTSPARGAGVNKSDLGALPFQVGAVASVAISPTTITLGAGDSLALTAVAYDSSGDVIPGATFTWSALSAAGTVTPQGVLKAACTPGTVMKAVTASYAGKSGYRHLEIVVGSPAAVTLSPSVAIVPALAQANFVGAVVDICGNPVFLKAVTWSTDIGAGSINSQGTYTAPCRAQTYSAGVRASFGTFKSTATVIVTPLSVFRLSLDPTDVSLVAGGQATFTATAADTCGNPLSPTLAWSTSVPGASVTPDGVFTASGPAGTYPGGVTVTAEGQTASAHIQIHGGTVSRVTMNAPTVTLRPGETYQFSAVATDSHGNVIAGSPSFSVTQGGGSIDATGLFTAGTTAGTFAATVKASQDGVYDSATVIVQPGPPFRLALTPGQVTLAPRGTTTFLADVFDAWDNRVTTSVTFSVSNSAVGDITTSGVFTAGTASGTYPMSVRAEVGALTASASVTIQNGALSQLVVTPGSASVSVGGTVAFTAVGKDSNGNTVTLIPTWTVRNGGGTIDSATGVFTAGTQSGTFVNTVQVSANGLSATASVEVTPAPIVRVEVTPNHVRMQASHSLQFSAQAFDAFGNSVTPTLLTWSASEPAGTITPDGLFTASALPGSYLMAVTATVGSINGRADVDIEPSEGMGASSNTAAKAEPVVGSSFGCRSVPPTALLWLVSLSVPAFASRRRRERKGQ